MESLLYLKDTGFVDILCFLAVSVSLRGAGWPVLAEVVLLHKEIQRISLEMGWAVVVAAGRCCLHLNSWWLSLPQVLHL